MVIGFLHPRYKTNDPWLWTISISDINVELFCPILIFEKRANISHNFD